MLVKKHSGDLVPYNPHNLRQSLTRSGASKDDVDKVFQRIEFKLYDGISTRELYQLAFTCLKDLKESYAARYSLKKALRDLGPEGYYFEKWVSRMFQDDGFQSTTGQLLIGHAVKHEIDVIAVKGDELLAVECKFRNDVDAKISVTTPMYFMSRVKDISNKPYTFFNKTLEVSAGWLVTNAYLTSDSIRFAECYNMNLLSWDYPKDASLKLRVDNMGEYPITCLTTIDDEEKAILLKKQCILVRDIVENPQVLQNIGADNKKKKRIVREATELLDTAIEE